MCFNSNTGNSLLCEIKVFMTIQTCFNCAFDFNDDVKKVRDIKVIYIHFVTSVL